MKIVILATEPSGDYLGAKLIKELKQKKKTPIIKGIGGEHMRNMNFKSWVKLSEFKAIGIYEVLKNLTKYIQIIKYTEKKIREFSPDIIITIDSPSFNYRLLKRLEDLKINNVKFFHYVAPTVWAWKEYRAKLYAKLYDKMFVLFKFERIYFTKYNLFTKHVGHQIFFEKVRIKKKRYLSFLPGSRLSEINNNIDEFVLVIEKSLQRFSDFQFYLLTFKSYQRLIEDKLKKFGSKIKVITDPKKKQRIMSESYLAIAASGSVTLELAKYQTPMIVVYKTHFLTQIILKILVKVKYASIINIYFDKLVVPELLFNNFRVDNVILLMEKLINSKIQRLKQISKLKEFSNNMLVENKNPSKLVVKYLK